MKHINLMVGLPGVGKTTFLQQDRFKNTTVVSSDSYIEDEAKARGSTYDQIFQEVIKDATSHFNSMLDHHLRNGTVSLTIDRTNLTVKSRNRFIQLARQFGYEIYAHDLNNIAFDDPGEWHRRLDSRIGKSIPDHVLEDMKKRYEPPTKDEGFHLVYIRKSLVHEEV